MGKRHNSIGANPASSALFKPSNYQDMDDWLNAFSRSAWIAVLGAYVFGGYDGVIQYVKTVYKANTELWKEKDLRHYFSCRKWSDFRTRGERI